MQIFKSDLYRVDWEFLTFGMYDSTAWKFVVFQIFKIVFTYTVFKCLHVLIQKIGPMATVMIVNSMNMQDFVQTGNSPKVSFQRDETLNTDISFYIL